MGGALQRGNSSASLRLSRHSTALSQPCAQAEVGEELDYSVVSLMAAANLAIRVPQVARSSSSCDTTVSGLAGSPAEGAAAAAARHSLEPAIELLGAKWTITT